MQRDQAERLLGALEAIMCYRGELSAHPNDRTRNAKLCEEMSEAREVALSVLGGVEHIDPESLF